MSNSSLGQRPPPVEAEMSRLTTGEPTPLDRTHLQLKDRGRQCKRFSQRSQVVCKVKTTIFKKSALPFSVK